MVLAWGLEQREKEDIEWTMRMCVKEEWLCGIRSLMAMMEPGIGFVTNDGNWIQIGKLCPTLRPFIRWSAILNRKERKTEAN
ncbi:hypothetical protein SUGI_0624050 [Cryptomeria japonica]|nr:hypothetical protein SUGI_0624050 [Cryptomeria japonica]